MELNEKRQSERVDHNKLKGVVEVIKFTN